MLELSQQKLRELEALCTKEQPPAAMAACPLHMDCRGICAAVSVSDFSKARELFEKTALFPGIVSRLCEEPCKGACPVKSLGGSVQMRTLERAALEYGTLRPKRLLLPRRQECAAVIGSGPAGLAAALELGKKGYTVHIYEQDSRIGGSLKDLELLPPEVLSEELERLNPFRIELRTDSPAEPEMLRKSYDAVILARGTFGFPVSADSHTFLTEQDGVFAAGSCLRSFGGTLVHALAEGRRAAISADRYLKKVSLDAGREGEAPFVTTLHVTLNGTSAEPPVSFGTLGGNPPSEETAVKEASRCIQCTCTDCIDACAFMRHYKAYPKKYLREFYNNLSIAMGTRHANRMINSCSLCGQCAAICPHGLDLGEAAREARQIMVERSKMPASSFEFALNDMRFSNSRDCFLAQADAGEPPSWLYFPGCQLPASAPGVTRNSYLDLRNRLSGGVGLMLGCCGIMAKWAGEQELYESTRTRLLEAWKDLEKPVLIAACPTCLSELSSLDEDIRCVGIWDILYETGLPPGYQKGNGTLRIHDACGARNLPQVHSRIRMLAELMGYTLTEGTYTRSTSGCCGYGGLAQYSNPSLADDMAGQVSAQQDYPYLTYCINCRDRFLRQKAEAYHILELLYPSGAEEHRWPSYSLRQKNRLLLKRSLLEQLWGIETKGDDTLKLQYAPETADLLEQRMILESDISAVIQAAEANKCRIRDTAAGLYIAHRRIGNVTFWVWYRPEGDGFFIGRVYAHRMEIKGE